MDTSTSSVGVVADEPRGYGRNRFSVLGTQVDAVTMAEAVDAVKRYVDHDAPANVTFCTASTTVEARRNALLRQALAEARLVAPDGMPLVWLGRRSAGADVERVYGPDFMVAFCAATGSSYRHFFYGGGPGVATDLVRRLRRRFPTMKVAGTLAPAEVVEGRVDQSDVDVINAARADIVWVGLGHPKQEVWMHLHRQKVDAPVMAGVGAAFDFLSGRKRDAPQWMKRSGLQWLHRLWCEPRRLWKRYLIGNVQFVLLLTIERIFSNERRS